MQLRWLLGLFAFGSLVACMVPNVTEKTDPCGAEGCAPAQANNNDSESKSTALQATTGTALPATESSAATTTHKDAGAPDAQATSATSSSSSSSGSASGDDDGSTGTGTGTGTGDDDDTTTPASCNNLIICCAALRSAGNDTDADACDTSYESNDDLTCFDAQYGYANPTDGTTGTCAQP